MILDIKCSSEKKPFTSAAVSRKQFNPSPGKNRDERQDCAILEKEKVGVGREKRRAREIITGVAPGESSVPEGHTRWCAAPAP